MSLQSNINDWLGDYTNTNVTDPITATKSIGSILTVGGAYHTGGAGESNSIYDPGSSLPYEIYDFKWYAGQGLDSSGFGSKFLVYSEGGISWDTKYSLTTPGKFEFETTGSIDTLYLGYNADTGYSPAQATLTAFDTNESLLVINNFDVAVDYVAFNTFGVADGNGQITVNAGNQNLFTYPGYYAKVTLNSAIIYDLTFDEAAASTSTFEYVLATYLSDFSNNAITINSDISVINNYLSSNGSSLSFEYYAQAGTYAPGGVITEALASAAAVESDLLLAA
ncbi:hypothetical protein E6C76_12150 [Pseudothauera nasutitermitis]|uniref:Uncharacterized protein n=1 Tax=Pseudothauera nasutitermitis TaxID=2565930 RepID=A0A4S4AXG8_9RHOO|nr:hypothetical protein [Pseudothauera nasutitermitis]THF64792.1 hypothetical protein E6C76_12150 [Pseudothauera nasutitermitis]